MFTLKLKLTLYDNPGFYTKLTLHYHHPSKEIQYQQYISCYWPNFNQTLKVSSWDQLEQLLNLTMTFIYIRNTSTVNNPTSTKMFGPIFFLHFFWTKQFFERGFVSTKVFRTPIFFDPKSFWTQNFFGQRIFWT